MGELEERIYEATQAAMADVQIGAQSNECFTPEDEDQIYDLTKYVVETAKTSFVADATVRAVRHYIEAFHAYVVAELGDPEKAGEFTEAVKGLLKEIKGE